MTERKIVVKTADEIEIQDGEEIVEEVIEDRDLDDERIEVEQVEWIGPMEQEEAGYYNEDDVVDHTIVEYDDSDNFQAFLPVREGVPVLSLNLPDLLSKPISFSDGTKMILCFNKKCQRQIAFSGFIYTLKNFLSDASWNHWRCVNPHCFGEIRTTPDFRELRVSHDHSGDCIQDETQIRLRVAIYDTRLMAEFTDAPLEALYATARDRIKNEYPEEVALLPSYESLKPTLLDHRENKIYRKRFEMQNLLEKQKKLNMTPDEVIYTESNTGLIKFRRTKPFPMSICNDCNDQFNSNSLPSQDNLISHYVFSHGRRMTIERFEFKDMNLFDQYIRELNILSRFKMRKMGLADENMYFLCVCDDRLAKNGVGRASRLQQQNTHCTAFIRVFDWRISSKKEGSRVLVDYCLEHQPHPEVPQSTKEEVDYYTPDFFLRDIEDRKARTVKLASEIDPRAKRSLEIRPYVPTGRVKPMFGTRSLAPPIAAQIAAGTRSPYVDVYDEREHISAVGRNRPKLRQSIRTAFPKETEEEAPTTSSGTSDPPPPSRLYVTQKPFQRLTERHHFKDIYTFNAICKMEDTCISLLNRMQNCQSTRVALGYKEKVTHILRQAAIDPALSEDPTQEDFDKSWVIQKPQRGRPKKRARMENGEEVEIEEEDEDHGEERTDRMEPIDVGMEAIEDVVLEETVVEETAVVNEKASVEPGLEEEEPEKQAPEEKSSDPGSSSDLSTVIKQEEIDEEPQSQDPPVTKRVTFAVPKKMVTQKVKEEQPAPQPDSTTRSGRTRKVPARLNE